MISQSSDLETLVKWPKTRMQHENSLTDDEKKYLHAKSQALDPQDVNHDVELLLLQAKEYPFPESPDDQPEWELPFKWTDHHVLDMPKFVEFLREMNRAHEQAGAK